MRIVGGTLRGRTLASPEGMTTRPTSDRARQAIFNIIEHAPWCAHLRLDESYILDIFSGTGAMGLEALSRGAQHAVFIDNDRQAQAACRKNLAAFKLENQTRLIHGDALQLSGRPDHLAPRTLVFLDPPYGKNLAAAALARAAAQGWLAEDALCVMEMARKAPEDAPAGFTLADTRHYGVAEVRFLLRDASRP